MWEIPVACMAAALIAAPLVRWIDAQTSWTLMGFGADGARNVIGALASSLLTFLVFVFSILLLAVQIASGQLTPRIISRLFENRATQWTIGAFVFAWVFSLAALGRVEERVPQLLVALAVLLGVLCVGLFLRLVQRAVQSMRPVAVLTEIAHSTRRVIEVVYPERFSKYGGEHAGLDLVPALARRTIRHRRRSAAVLALDLDGLVDIATRAGCAIEVVPQVGDFLAIDEDLFLLHGDGADAVAESDLLACVSLGPERTLEQDPLYGFRIIVDVAARALSPAINDPTTGVLAIDQLNHLLHLLGWRQLDTGVLRDAAGVVRVVYRTPDWEDFVAIAATEIRVYGASSPQIARRLQAMFDHLLRTVPPERGAALREQVALLERAVERTYADPEDRAFALRGDLQGVGSRQRGEAQSRG
jgi:uncharacterized membrane protein